MTLGYFEYAQVKLVVVDSEGGRHGVLVKTNNDLRYRFISWGVTSVRYIRYCSETLYSVLLGYAIFGTGQNLQRPAVGWGADGGIIASQGRELIARAWVGVT